MNIKLRAARESAGRTQVELAQAVGLSERTYKYIEHGERFPRADVAIKIAKALNSTVEELFG